jgi:hypothetical protein
MSRTLAADEPPFLMEDTSTHTHTHNITITARFEWNALQRWSPIHFPLIQLHSWRADLLLLLLQRQRQRQLLQMTFDILFGRKPNQAHIQSISCRMLSKECHDRLHRIELVYCSFS